MGLASDFTTLSADQTAAATAEGAVLTAQAAAAAAETTVTSASQAVVADLSVTATYPGSQALLPDPNPLPGGSYLLVTLAPGTTLGFAVQQIALAQ